MRSDEILLLGIGIQPPWQLVYQHLDTSTQPHKLHLQVAGERGARYPCPQCGALSPAHDFTEKRWCHLNFFQHHCCITASVPRVKCPKHGVHLVEVPWARKGSAFPLLFERKRPAKYTLPPSRCGSDDASQSNEMGAASWHGGSAVGTSGSGWWRVGRVAA